MFMRLPSVRALSLAACLFGVTSHETALVAPSLVVNLTSGTFRGVANSNGTDAWLGIPFAQPPIGPLRFKAPLPITQPLQAVQDASQFGDACPQPPSSSLGANISENCLSLNVCSMAFECLVKRQYKHFVGMAPNRNFSGRTTSCDGLVLCKFFLNMTGLCL